MKIFSYFCIGAVLGAGSLLLFTKTNVLTVVFAKQIVSPLPSPFPTYTPIPTPSPKPTPTPTPLPTPTSTPTRLPTPTPSATSQQIYEFIEKYAGQYGVDPNVLRHTALCESGFNPGAANSVYLGLFQFDGQTWQKYRSLMGLDTGVSLRANAEEAVRTAAYVYSIHATGIWPHCVPSEVK